MSEQTEREQAVVALLRQLWLGLSAYRLFPGALERPGFVAAVERIRFGVEGGKGVVQYPDGSLRVVDVAEAGENSLLVHDSSHTQASLAFALSRITFETDGAVPLGVFRSAERPVYDDLMSAQLETAREQSGEGDLATLLHSGDTWTVGAK